MDRCGDDAVALGVERHGADRGAVAGRPTPAAWVGLAGSLVQGVASGQHGTVPTSMALRRGDVADPAVTVLIVVPGHEIGRPLPSPGEVGKACGGEVRAVLGSAE